MRGTEARQLIIGLLKSSNYSYNVFIDDDSSFRLQVACVGQPIETWYDIEKNVFGFKMLSGHIRTYSSWDTYKEMFILYLDTNTQFVPLAKRAVDMFSASMDIQCIYDKVMPSNDGGYQVSFKVLGGGNRIVLVKVVEGVILVRQLGVNSGGTSGTVVSEYKYKVGSNNEMVMLPTIYSYLSGIRNKYQDEDRYNIVRTAEDKFDFMIEGFKISACLMITPDDTVYNIVGLNDIPVDVKLRLEDIYDLSALYMACKQYYDDMCLADEGEINQEGVDVEQKPDQEQSDIEAVTDSSSSDMPESYDVASMEGDDVNETGVSVDLTTEMDNSDKEEVVEDMVLKVIKDGNGSVVSLVFVSSGDIVAITAEKARSLGFPVERVLEEAVTVKRFGVSLLEDEIRTHTFVKDITEDTERCNQMINSIFG